MVNRDGRPRFRMYLVTDRHQTRGGDLVETCRLALSGAAPGEVAVQLREKDLSGRDLYRLARQVHEETRPREAPLLINDRLDIALAAGAEIGVHLPVSGLPVKEARGLAGERLVGVSTHSLAEAREAEAGGADFIVFGPVYPTPSKVSYGRPRGPGALHEVCAGVDLPVYAIGGINAARVNEVMDAGASGAALISAVMAAPDPARAVKQILVAMDGC